MIYRLRTQRTQGGPVYVQKDEGAEWNRMKITSARSERFSEEDQWWRIGMVTREGTIKGVDPSGIMDVRFIGHVKL